MKKIFVTLVITIFSVSFFECEHSVDFAEGEFAICLFADSTVTAVEAAQQPLNAPILSQSSIISVNDITHYKWRDHSFSLKPGAGYDLRSTVKRRQTVRGIPFIVVADNERIYLGAFWFAYSSIAPTFPFIDASFAFFDAPLSTLTIEKSWIDNQPDIRNDPRIYMALKSAGVLIE